MGQAQLETYSIKNGNDSWNRKPTCWYNRYSEVIPRKEITELTPEISLLCIFCIRLNKSKHLSIYVSSVIGRGMVLPDFYFDTDMGLEASFHDLICDITMDG